MDDDLNPELSTFNYCTTDMDAVLSDIELVEEKVIPQQIYSPLVLNI
jgi:hypothetical protein